MYSFSIRGSFSLFLSTFLWNLKVWHREKILLCSTLKRYIWQLLITIIYMCPFVPMLIMYHFAVFSAFLFVFLFFTCGFIFPDSLSFFFFFLPPVLRLLELIILLLVRIFVIVTAAFLLIVTEIDPFLFRSLFSPDSFQTAYFDICWSPLLIQWLHQRS